MAKITKETVKRALNNDVEAQYQFAYWFYENQMIESAYFWAKRAAEQDYPEAVELCEKLKAARES